MASTFHAMDVDASHPSNPATLNMPRPSELPQTDHIILDVDGRKFRTRKSTLEHCEYFSNQLSGRWQVDLLPDGSLPVEADPEIFPILLAYLRRPAVFPLLWTREKGFDYVGYNRLLAEADFFGLDELKEWITQKKYLAVVKTGYKLEIHPGQFNNEAEFGLNYTWLHVAPIPGSEVLDLRQRFLPTLQDPSLPEDKEIVACFEAKIPSYGKFCCACGRPDHFDVDDCAEFAYHADIGMPYEKLQTSIVTVIKYIDYRPERCMKGYVEPIED